MLPVGTLNIRNLTAADLDLLQGSMPASRRLLDGVLRTYHETRFAAQEEGSANYLIAWVDGDPVGHVFLRWSADEPFLRERNIAGPLAEALAVRSDMQSKGIGTALMLEAERLAVQRGCSRLGLAVGVENHRARALYARLGYRDKPHEEFRLTWMSLDADGEERIGGETCTYLVKALTTEAGA